MGNRGGRIHDPATKTLLKRRYASRRWIICTCTYQDWHREVMGTGYTELFFLDEITALAAGHRPCALCRRQAFRCYSDAFDGASSADAMDEILHRERLGIKLKAVMNLPDGAMVATGQEAFARKGDAALMWRFDGYQTAGTWADLMTQKPVLLTPPSSVDALKNGYQPVWHPSSNT
jgi:hypothetical protein